MSGTGYWQRPTKPNEHCMREVLWVASSTQQRKNRRAARKHAARMFAAGCPEKASVWLKRARNG